MSPLASDGHHFTNKAAGELKDRLEAMLGEEGRDIWASTFTPPVQHFKALWRPARLYQSLYHL